MILASQSLNCYYFRKFPVDMAGFAINLRYFLKKPSVMVGLNVRGHSSRNGYLETDLLEHFTTKGTVECLGSNHEVNNASMPRTFVLPSACEGKCWERSYVHVFWEVISLETVRCIIYTTQTHDYSFNSPKNHQ